jgi:hypothetical protein
VGIFFVMSGYLRQNAVARLPANVVVTLLRSQASYVTVDAGSCRAGSPWERRPTPRTGPASV